MPCCLVAYFLTWTIGLKSKIMVGSYAGARGLEAEAAGDLVLPLANTLNTPSTQAGRQCAVCWGGVASWFLSPGLVGERDVVPAQCHVCSSLWEGGSV